MKTKVTELLQIEYPIIQGGMAWVAEHPGADPRTCGVFGTGKCPARERFGSDNQNKRFETVPVSAVKAIS